MDLVRRVIVCMSLVTYCSGQQDSTESHLEKRIIPLTAWLGKEMYNAGNMSSQSMAFSALSYMGTLIQMNSVAYHKVSQEIQEALGVFGKSPSYLCDAFNSLVSMGSCYNRHNYSVSFHRNLFYDQSFNLYEGPLKNSCFQNDFSKIDFSNQSETVTEINNWYSNLLPRSQQKYLTKVFGKKTKFIFLNSMKLSSLNHLGYHKHREEFSVYNIRKSTRSFPSMHKVGDYYYQGPKNGFSASLLREDLPGGRYSLVFLMVYNQAEMYLKEFMEVFSPGNFTRHFEAALNLTNKTQMRLVLPEINLNTVTDLKKPLENICVTSLFRQEGPMDELFAEKAKVFELPLVNSFHFKVDNISKEKIETNCSTTEINVPFWLILADRQKRVPISNALFLGLGGIDKNIPPSPKL